MPDSGPMPKRAAERRRRNKVVGAETVTVAGRVPVPALPKTTHDIARRWYNALRRSGQSQFYEPSDWAAALLISEQITRMMVASNMAIKAGDAENIPFKAGHFAALWTAMEALLTTEGARRRVRMEIERPDGKPEAVPEGVADIEDYRLRAGRPPSVER